MEMPNEFFTIASLATYAGLVAAVFLIVAWFKPFIKPYGDIWVRPFALAVALVLQFFILLVTKAVAVESVGLAVVNGFLVSVGASGVHEIIKDPAAKTPQTIKPPDMV